MKIQCGIIFSASIAEGTVVDSFESVQQGFFAIQINEGAVGIGDKEDGENAVPVRLIAGAWEGLTTEGENLSFCGIRGDIPDPHRVLGT